MSDRVLEPETNHELYLRFLMLLEKTAYAIGPMRLLKSNMNGMIPNSIFEAGCGGGRFSSLLSDQYPFAYVLGADICKAAIDFAKSSYSGRFKLRYAVLDVRSAQHGPIYDLTCCNFLLHHMKEPDAAIDSLLASTRTLFHAIDLVRDWPDDSMRLLERRLAGSDALESICYQLLYDSVRASLSRKEYQDLARKNRLRVDYVPYRYSDLQFEVAQLTFRP
jgi:SAM-dependent methyltransferase